MPAHGGMPTLSPSTTAKAKPILRRFSPLAAPMLLMRPSLKMRSRRSLPVRMIARMRTTVNLPDPQVLKKSKLRAVAKGELLLLVPLALPPEHPSHG